jgi:uncharacterized membrane protein YedE/YeeE
MKRILAALLAGTLFGVGLALSRMSDPTVILGFLDLFGHFDPSLAFVLAGAVGTTLVGFRIALGRQRPLFADEFQVPASRAIDRPLVVGSAIFGIGWGLSGYCPGPALVALAGGVGTAFVVVPAMIVGSLVQRFVFQNRTGV